MSDSNQTRSDLVEFSLNVERPESGKLPIKFELDPESNHVKSLGDGSYGMVFKAVDAGATDLQAPTELYAVKVLYDRRGTGAAEEPQHQTDQRQITELDELRIAQSIANRLEEAFSIWDTENPHLAEGDEVDLSEPASDRGTADDWRSARDKLAELSTPRSLSRYLVLPRAASTEFSFPGVEGDDSAKIFADDEVSFSRYAYVMERYEDTLKQLMEGRLAEDKAAAQPVDEAHELTGAGSVSSRKAYASLIGASRLHRALEALRVGIDLSKGLCILYASRYRHQDIKPANIFCSGVGEDSQYRLGDLGFLEPTPASGAHTTIRTDEYQGMGSIHYRSPEQRDAQDEAECLVNWENANRATLLTADPKFAGTRIEKGDFCFFAKDGEKIRYLIHDAVRTSEGLKQLTIGRPDDRQVRSDRHPPSRHNLVKFVKRSTSRTDLFGLGAVMFDIVSAGRSPERFYDELVGFDRSISLSDELISFYNAWRQGGTADPAISSVFDALHPESNADDHLPEILVYTITRLMASSPSDSFHSEYDFASSDSSAVSAAVSWFRVTRALEQAKQQLEDLLTPPELRASYCLGGPNVTQEPIELEGPDAGARPTTLRGLLKEIVEEDSAYVRWVRGAKLIGSAVELVNERHEVDGSDWSSIAPLSPDSVGITPNGRDLKFAGSGKRLDHKSFLDLLSNRDPFILRIPNHADPISPEWWLDEMVSVDVQFQKGAELGCTVVHRPLSRSLTRIEVGDYLLPIDRVASRKQVYRVTSSTPPESGGRRSPVRSCKLEAKDRSVSPDNGSYFLVKAPHPVDYYSSVLANLLYRALYGVRPGANYGGSEVRRMVFAPPELLSTKLAGQPIDTLARPSVYVSGQAKLSSKMRERLKSRPRPNPTQLPAADDDAFERLNTHTFCLLSWLHLGGFKSASSKDASAEHQIKTEWKSVETELLGWVDSVHDFWMPGERTGLRSLTAEVPIHEPRPKISADVADPALWAEVLDSYLKPS